MNLKRDKKTKNIAGNGEEKINNPLYTPFPSSKLNKLKKKNNTTKQVKEKSYKSPKKKTKMGFLKVTSKILVLVAVYQIAVSLYLINANKEQNFTNDFDTDSVIQDPNGNDFETDDNGQINPFPVTNEEKKAIILYCSSGIRTKEAIMILNSMGYTNLYIWEYGSLSNFPYKDMLKI